MIEGLQERLPLVKHNLSPGNVYTKDGNHCRVWKEPRHQATLNEEGLAPGNVWTRN